MWQIKHNLWILLRPKFFFKGVAVSVLDGYLYAIGGSDGTSPLASVERFDPATSTWTSVKQMGTKRKHLGAAVYQGCIYAGKIFLKA